MNDKNQEALFISQWKNEVYQILKLRYGNKLSKKKIMDYLDDKIHKTINNRKVTIVNNYTNKQTVTDILSLIDFINDNQLIIGGAGCIYYNHEQKDNVVIDYILDLKSLRNKYKAERKNEKKGTYEWLIKDIFQLNTKTKMNSLYGCFGYDGFHLHNRFIAESITNCGRQIISTAVMTFENFMTGSIKFNTENELYIFIKRILSEFNNLEHSLDCSIFSIDNIDFALIKHLLELCAFDQSDSFVMSIQDIVANLSYDEKVYLYYKNNLFEFSRIPFIKEKLKFISNNLTELMGPEVDLIENTSVISELEELWNFYNTFVVYDYPNFDRVRKTMYSDREAVLYIDTDSNFLALNKWVTFINDEVLENNFNKDKTSQTFISVNVFTIILSRVIDKGLHTLCKYMNIEKEFADLLIMKNEFYLERIVFTNAKKRYISNAILQEKVLLNDGKGLPEIKGFDFKKSVTKDFVREYYTQICLNDILSTKNINVPTIYKKMIELRKDIEESMRNGESKYYKQANVQMIEHYKNPYSTQGITAVLLWNCLCPEYQMDLPTDVDIIPIKSLTLKIIKNAKTGEIKYKEDKYVSTFKEQYPDAYQRLKNGIYDNPNPLISKMGLKYIAKPKNSNIELPYWFNDLINTEKVVNDTLGLFTSICESLGMKSLKTNASTSYITSIVDL